MYRIPVLLLFLPTMLFSQKVRYIDFWRWFTAHSDVLQRAAGSSGPALDSLGAALARVHPALTFELGPQATRRDLVLSADGIRAAFPEVEALYSAAPKMAEWHVIKFRPRRAPSSTLTLAGRRFDPARARFLLVKDDPGKVGIILFLEHFSRADHDLFAKAGFLILDEALGEYDMETRVGAIDFLAADSPYFARSRPLAELPAAFDAFFIKP
jgi:hypothetical protein